MLKKWNLLKQIINNNNFSISDVKVACAILDHYNEKIQQIHPTNRRLVYLTKLSLRQVQLSTAKLHQHKLVHKLSIKGKNHYKLTMDLYQNYEQNFAPRKFTTNRPSPPTKHITNIDISKITKKLAKQTNPYYKATINNGLGYHQNIENKYVKLMRLRLSTNNYSQWLEELNEQSTKQAALSYAKYLCG